jgi:hypothetical protein
VTVEPLLTAADVMRVLRVSRNEVYRLLNGPIPTVRCGASSRSIRVRPGALIEWLASQEQRPRGDDA